LLHLLLRLRKGVDGLNGSVSLWGVAEMAELAWSNGSVVNDPNGTLHSIFDHHLNGRKRLYRGLAKWHTL
jgi:hypothetical protein